jgi:pimeloyl-ACP methyl ester carboxylesterase
MTLFRHSIRMQSIGAVIGAVCATLVATAAPAGAADSATRSVPVPRCSPIEDRVAMPSGTMVTVRGDVCGPRSAGTVEVLLSGVTYDRAYWELPPGPGLPSYTQYAVDHGATVLVLDRIGTGASDRPPATEVSLDANVQTLHEVIQDLRNGRLTGHPVNRILVVGHSFGASVGVAESVRYSDVNGLVLTAFLHGVGPRILEFGASLIPAAEDPIVGLTRPPSGYLTTRPGSRSDLLYDHRDSLATVRIADELLKSTTTTAEMADIAVVQSDPSITQAIRVPVLLVLGEHDALLCGGQIDCSSAATVTSYEAQFYSAPAALTTFVLPQAGHSINLHLNAPLWFQAAAAQIGRISTSP